MKIKDIWFKAISFLMVLMYRLHWVQIMSFPTRVYEYFKYREPLPTGIKTYEELRDWRRNNYTWRSDGMWDWWSRPQATVQRKKGDCEDIAQVNKALSEDFERHPSYYLSVFWRTKGGWWIEGHTVLMIPNKLEMYRQYEDGPIEGPFGKADMSWLDYDMPRGHFATVKETAIDVWENYAEGKEFVFACVSNKNLSPVGKMVR